MKHLFFLLLIAAHSSLLAVPDIEKHKKPQYPFSVLLIADTSNPKTKASHLADVKRMNATCKAIAAQIGLKPEITVLQGKDATYANIIKWSKWPRKVFGAHVLIYYSGESVFNNSYSNSLNIKLAKGKANQPQSLSIDQLRSDVPYGMISSLCVYLVDCYDKIRKADKNCFDFPPLLSKTGNQKGLPYLFWKSNGNLIACSSTPGKQAYGICQGEKKGGLFTLFFCESIARTDSRPVFWEAIIEGLRKKCLLFVRQETPYKPLPQEIYADLRNVQHPNYEPPYHLKNNP